MEIRNKPTYTLVSALFFFGCIQGGRDGGDTRPAQVRGSLLKDGGAPALNTRVSAYPVDHLPGDTAGNHAAVYTTQTGSYGEFAFDEIPAGEYNITATGEGLSSIQDSVVISGKSQNLLPDTLRRPGSLHGRVSLQPQHDPRTVVAQVLGTDIFVNIDSSGGFTLENLAEGNYRMKVSSILPQYVQLFKTFTITEGLSDTLPETLQPFFSGIPVVGGIRAVPDSDGAVILSWNKTAYPQLQSFLIFRDSTGVIVPSQSAYARTMDTIFIDTIYSRTPRAGQFPYLDKEVHKFTYRVRILNKSDEIGPSYGNVEGSAVPPIGKFGSMTLTRVVEHAPFYGRRQPGLVAFQDKLWLIGGDIGGRNLRDVWNSSDGSAWTLVTDSARLGDPSEPVSDFGGYEGVVVFKDRLLWIGPRLSGVAVFASTDGSNWTKITDSTGFTLVDFHTLLAFRNRLWLLNGKEIWSSEDGGLWALVDSPAAGGAIPTTGAVFQDKLWIVGTPDRESDSPRTVAWNSDDGANWAKVLDTAAILPILGNALAAAGGKLWSVGGNLDNQSFKFATQIHGSADGKNWFAFNMDSSYRKRLGAKAVFLRDRIWLVGGLVFPTETSRSPEWTNEVWTLKPQ